MCCTGKPSRMSDTKIYAGLAKHEGKDVHVLAYQNSAENISQGPNAMVLPFPAAEKMTQDNVIDTSEFKNFLNDIGLATKTVYKSARLSRGMLADSLDEPALVFKVGSYTVILAENVSQIPEALNRVPENERPNLSEDFLAGYEKLYPDQPIAVCCWDGSVKAEPLLWWYVPRDKNLLFIPTMDAHDGRAPNLESKVKTDHIISIGARSTEFVGTKNKVRYRDSVPAKVMALLPSFVYGTQMEMRLPNGDMYANATNLGVDGETPQIFRVSSSGTLTFNMLGWE